MQLGTGRIAPGQFRLDVHVNILQFLLPLKSACCYFAGDFIQRLFNLKEFRGGQHPILWSMAAWASEPRMSCSHNRQSKEMDSVNLAASAAGPDKNRALRETGDCFFIGAKLCELTGVKSRLKGAGGAR